MAGMPYFSQVPFWTCGKPRPRGTYPFYLAVGGFVPRFQTWTGDGDMVADAVPGAKIPPTEMGLVRLLGITPG